MPNDNGESSNSGTTVVPEMNQDEAIIAQEKAIEKEISESIPLIDQKKPLTGLGKTHRCHSKTDKRLQLPGCKRNRKSTSTQNTEPLDRWCERIFFVSAVQQCFNVVEFRETYVAQSRRLESIPN